MASKIDLLARRIISLEKNVRALKTPQLAYSSIEDGAIEEYDENDNLVQIIGRQFDDTHTVNPVNGPTPPVPEQAFITPAVAGLRITWQGDWAERGVYAPLDFARVEVHASTDPNFEPIDNSTVVGIISSARGGTIFAALPYVEHTVKLVCWSQTGKFSAPSAAAFGTPQFVGEADLDPDLNLGGGPASDGNAPATAPVVTARPGLEQIHVTWDAVTNADPVTYEVHASATQGFTPDATTQVAMAASTLVGVDALPDGSPLAAPTYFLVRAVDADGAGPWSTETSATAKAGVSQEDLDASANGINRVFHSETEPAGTPERALVAGDTWFQYNASGNLVAMHRHDGTIWQPLPVSHEAIASIDLGKATVGFLSGQRIEAESIGTREISSDYAYLGDVSFDQMTGGKLQAEVTIAGKMKTADAGARVEIDPAGVNVFKADGTPTITLPTDPAQEATFQGAITADGLTVTDGLEIRGRANIYARGSKTVLETQTTGSATAPGIVVDYPTHVEPFLGQPYRNATGFAIAGGARVGAHAFYGDGMLSYNDAFWYWPQVSDGAGGTRADFLPEGGLTYVRPYAGAWGVAVLGNQAGDTESRKRIRVYTDLDTNIPFGNEPLLYTTIDYGLPANIYRSPRIGWTNAINVVATAEYTYDGRGFLRTYNIQTGSKVAEVTTPVIPDADGILGIAYGPSQLFGMSNVAGENVWVIAATRPDQTNGWAYVYSADGQTRKTTYEFPLNGQPIFMAVKQSSSTPADADFQAFQTILWNHDTVTTHTDISWIGTQFDAPWFVGYTWYDSNPAGDGIHETNLSIMNSFTMKKRARISLSAPPLPDPAAGPGEPRGVDDVNAVRFYIGLGPTAPAREAMWQQPGGPADLATALIIDSSTELAFSGTNPPVLSTFPTEASAVLQSSAIGSDSLPKLLLSGDGFAHFEALDVSGDGSTSFTGRAFDQLFYSIRAQTRLVGGGVITVSPSSEVRWGSSIYSISLGRDADLAPDGFFVIDMPPVDTVIPGYGGASNATVTSAGIPIPAWRALWYELPFGESSASKPGNFRMTAYTTNFVPPNNWILIAVNNSLDGRIEFAIGDRVRPGTDNQSLDQLVVTSGTDANSNSGNTPPLRIGDINGTHLRIDGNEIISMVSDTSEGSLGINGCFVKKFAFGTTVLSTNASGIGTVAHNLGLSGAYQAMAQVASHYGTPAGILIDSKNANNFTYRLYKLSDGSLLTSQTRTVEWQVWQ